MNDLITRLTWLAFELEAPNSCGGALVREAIATLKQQNWVSTTCGDHDTVYLIPDCPKCHAEHVSQLDDLGDFQVFDPGLKGLESNMYPMYPVADNERGELANMLRSYAQASRNVSPLVGLQVSPDVAEKFMRAADLLDGDR